MTKISLLNLTLGDTRAGMAWSGDLVADGIPIATIASLRDGIIEVLTYLEGASEKDLFDLDDSIVTRGRNMHFATAAMKPLTLYDLCSEVVSAEILRRNLHTDEGVLTYGFTSTLETSGEKIDVYLFDADDLRFQESVHADA